MPIINLLWPDPDSNLPNASDIHVVRDHPSPSLLDRVQVAREGGLPISAAKYIADNPEKDVTLRFQPSFRGVESSHPDGPHYDGFGVRVNMRTGVVQITEELSPFTPLNFIMVISARHEPDGKRLGDERVVRVHAHNALQRVWLTPSRLTVRRLLPKPQPKDPPPQGSEPPDPRDTHMRFVVRAQFDDKVIGDLTLESGTTWKSRNKTGPTGNVNDRGRLLVDRDDLPDTEVEITATLDARFGEPPAGRSATATMVVKKGWHQLPDAERPVIALVNGSGVPKKDKPETHMPNVVLMADGWESPAEFERLTTKMGKTLRTSRLLRPFPHLVDSMCIWSWFVAPVPVPGIPPVHGACSVLSEVYLFEVDGKLFARVMPSAMRPPEQGKLTLESLLYVVGLPMPGEQRSVDDLPKHWKATCRDFVESRVDSHVIEEWLKLRARTFVHCVDTEFHIGFGQIPSVEPLLESPIPAVCEFPSVFNGLESLSSAITVLTATKATTLFGGRPLGELWSDPKKLVEPHPRFDNRRFVMGIVPFAGARSHGGGAQTPALFSTGNQLDGFHVQPSTDSKRGGHELAGEALPEDIEANFYELVHELTHCFGLGDEYAEFPTRYAGSTTVSPNLQSDAEVRDPAGHISGNLIRWNWHRIQAAAVIEEEITPQGSFFAIDVRPGLATQFSPNQKVLLRLREFREAFIIEPTVLGFPLRIETIVGDHRLLVSPTKPTDLEALRLFKPGSIVFLPIEGPPVLGDPSPSYMQLITRQIRDKITHDNEPLWAAASDPKNLTETQYPKLRELSTILLRCPKNTWRVIGLYEGGERMASGIYHPAGGCLMRSGGDDVKELCAVCRYVLTDVIDPSLHNANEAVYGEIYTPEGLHG